MPTEAHHLSPGTQAPEFSLSDVVSGDVVTFASLLHRDPGTNGVLILFLCAHCPYVKHVEQAITRLADSFGTQVAFAAISANDPAQYPEDAPAGMREQATRNNWRFPYLFDSTQEVAHSFDAACTPESYLFDREGRLAYHGRIDSTRPARTPGAPQVTATGDDLRAALAALIEGRPPLADQFASIGCSIKWTIPVSGEEPRATRALSS